MTFILNILYHVVIQPLEISFGFLFQAFTEQTTVGMAIVLISLVVNVLLLPVQWHSDTALARLRQKQKAIEPTIHDIKRAYRGSKRFFMLRTLYRQADYHPAMELKTTLGLMVQIPFFIAAWRFLSQEPALVQTAFGPLSDLSRADGLGPLGLNLLPLLMTLLSLISAMLYHQRHGRGAWLQTGGLAVVFLILLYPSASGVVVYWTVNNLFSLLKHIVPLRRPVAMTDDDPASLLFLSSLSARRVHEVYALSVCILLATIFYIAPLNLFNSDPLEFRHFFSDILAFHYSIFVRIAIVLTVVYLCASAGIKRVLAGVVFYVALVSALYGYVFKGDYGPMTAFTFNNNNLSELWPDMVIMYDFAIVVVTAAGCWLLLSRAVKLVPDILRVLSLSLCIYAVFISVEAIKVLPPPPPHKIERHDIAVLSDQTTAASAEKFYAFSRDRQNVVVVMLDMFDGGAIDELLRRYPHLRAELDGFIWYPNTVTPGTSTLVSEPAIHGGHRFSPEHFVDSINANPQLVDDYIVGGYELMVDVFAEADFRIALTGVQSIGCSQIEARIDSPHLTRCIGMHDYGTVFADYWATAHPEEFSTFFNGDLRLSRRKSIGRKLLGVIGLFRVAPYRLRQHIYQRQWLGQVKGTGKWRQFSALASLPSVSFIDDSPLRTLHYLQTQLTHHPFNVSEGCQLLVHTGYHEQDRATWAQYCTLKLLGNWITWMKAHHVYDNTRIIFVSDHNLFEVKNDLPVLMSVHGLMMIKDFASHGPVREDRRLLSAADTLAIAYSGFGDDARLIQDPTRHSIANRKLRVSKYSGNQKRIIAQYEVTGSIFEPENWKQIK